MLNGLKILFASILAFMVGATVKASLFEDVITGLRKILAEPWAAATLADAYCGFITFYVWVFYKEESWAARLAWFAAIMALGNIAMAAYVLRQLARLPQGARVEDLLLKRPAI